MSTPFVPLEYKSFYGLNTKTSRAVMPMGFSNDLHDIDLSIPGIAKTRAGAVKFTASQLGYNATRIHDYYVPSSKAHIFLGSGGTKVFKLSALGVKTEIGSGFTSGLVFDFVNFKNTCYMTNGGSGSANEPKAYYDPTATFRKWGITKPSAAPSAAASGGGGLTGAYQYKVTFVNTNTGHESSASDPSSTANPAGNSVALTSIPVSTDAQVTQRYIYRTTNGGSIFFFLDMIADNTTTTYTDNTGDASLGTTEAPLYNDPPPNFKFIAIWDGRPFGYVDGTTSIQFANDDFYTQNGLPEESFAAPNTIELNAEVRGLKQSPNFDQLWVHTSKGVVAIKKTGDPADPYEPTVLGPDKYSTISHYSLVNIENEQWFVDEFCKVRSIDSTGFVRYKSRLIEEELVGDSDTHIGANFTLLRNIQAVHYLVGVKNQYRFILPQSGQSTPNKMYAANYLQATPPTQEDNELRLVYAVPVRYPVWEVHNITSTCMGIVKDSNGIDTLYTGSTDQYIKKQDIGTNDDGVAIDWSFEVGWQRAGETPNKMAFPYSIFAYFKSFSNYNISLRTDFDFGAAGGQVYSLSMAATGARLDIDFVLDQSLLGATGLKKVSQRLAGDYHYLNMTFFGNALDQVMEMHSLTLSSQPLNGVREND